jgi:hypothetical protein
MFNVLSRSIYESTTKQDSARHKNREKYTNELGGCGTQNKRFEQIRRLSCIEAPIEAPTASKNSYMT